MITQLKKEIDQGLSRFLKQTQKEYKLKLVNPALYESIREFTLRDGKRIRPLLLILSYKGYDKKNKKLTPSFFNASTCIELLHVFMLIHDDIIDRSDLRRGKPTLHRMLENTIATKEQEKLGYDLSIVAGDIVYALAIDAFLNIDEEPERKVRALKYFIQTATYTAMGEFVDTLHSVDQIQNIKEKDVYLNYTLKTARYTFDCPLVTGAILAGANEKEIANLSKFSISIGQAFQIQDDIIGIFDSEKNIGKSILSDFAECKKTLLMCHAFHKLKGKAKKEFMTSFDKPKKTLKDLNTMRTILIKSGSLHYALKAVQTRLRESQKVFAQLKLKAPYRDYISESLFDKLFKHSQRIADEYEVEIEVMK